jgi:cell wall-associated NlpC family hydrolase
MWILVRWFAGLLLKDLLLEHAGQILAAVAFTVVLVFATITWAFAVIAQPAGIYWLAAQAPAELQAQHPLQPIVGAPGSVPAPTAMPVPTVAPSAVSDRVQFMLAQARTWLNPPVPYQWGGCSRRGVDCSCFVQNVLATIGISAPRTTVTQWPWVRQEPRSELRPGDLVFFNNTCRDCGQNPTHVGMYVGNGQMIEAGDPVQITTIESGFYLAHYAGAGRPPGL